MICMGCEVGCNMGVGVICMGCNMGVGVICMGCEVGCNMEVG